VRRVNVYHRCTKIIVRVHYILIKKIELIIFLFLKFLRKIIISDFSNFDIKFNRYNHFNHFNQITSKGFSIC